MNWLKRKLSDWVVETNARELTRFVATIPRDAHTLGMTAAAANDLRLRMLRGNGWDLRDPALTDDCPNVGVELGDIIKRLRRHGHEPMAAAAMIWLHTIRAAQWPELRPLALQMWRLIEEGFEHLELVNDDLFALTGNRFMLDDAAVIPPILFQR